MEIERLRKIRQSIIRLETGSAVIAALGVVVGLLGILWQSKTAIWAMVVSVFLFAFLRLLVGMKQISALDEPTVDLLKIATSILRWDSWANVIAALGVGFGLIGIMFSRIEPVYIMVFSIFVYAFAIFYRGRLQLRYEMHRPNNLVETP